MADQKISYRFFWTWDHSTNWRLGMRGAQNSGVGNYYGKDAETFVIDYKRAVDWCAAHKMDAMGCVGMLRDSHGGVDAAREICRYARERGVRMYMIAGLYSYGGIYYEGDSPWSLDRFFQKNPDAVGRREDGAMQIRRLSGYYGHKEIISGCSTHPGLNQYILESLDWLFRTIPELGGIQMETGDVGICHCPRCKQRRADAGLPDDAEMSFHDMAQIYPKAAEVIWGRDPDAWVICESYRHYLSPESVFFSTPSPELDALAAMPEKTFWQWKCDRELLRGTWHGEAVPASMKKFRHIMRAHSGTQWWGGRHTLAVEKIRQQCAWSHRAGLQGVSLFGEGAPFHTNVEFNYLALEYFSDHPEHSLSDFAGDVLAPLLGGKCRAERYLELGMTHLEPEKIPGAASEIALIQQGITDYEVLRRWQYLASFLNGCYWESKQLGYRERVESRNLNFL